MGDYFAAFNALLAETDILYTKPSELSFFAALEIPLGCAPPEDGDTSHHRAIRGDLAVARARAAPEAAVMRLRRGRVVAVTRAR